MKSLEFSNKDKMPLIGLGTWKSEKGEVYNAVREAISTGYRHIDCAYIYFNEAEIGQALKDAFTAGDVRREEMWITSKLWNNAHTEGSVRPALLKTLEDLQLDYLDLYLIHWPVAFKNQVIFPEKNEDLLPPEEVPLSTTWKGMEVCVTEGLTRHIGVSNFSIQKLKQLLKSSAIQPEMNQIEMHPFHQQEPMLEFCRQNNIHLTAYSPLGSQDRNPVMKAKDEPNLLTHPVVLDIADKRQCTAAQVLIAWAFKRNTAAIPKSTNPGRIRENFESQHIELTRGDMKRISKMNRDYRYIKGDFFVFEGGPYTIENLWN